MHFLLFFLSLILDFLHQYRLFAAFQNAMHYENAPVKIYKNIYSRHKAWELVGFAVAGVGVLTPTCSPWFGAKLNKTCKPLYNPLFLNSGL